MVWCKVRCCRDITFSAVCARVFGSGGTASAVSAPSTARSTSDERVQVWKNRMYDMLQLGKCVLTCMCVQQCSRSHSGGVLRSIRERVCCVVRGARHNRTHITHGHPLHTYIVPVVSTPHHFASRRAPLTRHEPSRHTRAHRGRHSCAATQESQVQTRCVDHTAPHPAAERERRTVTASSPCRWRGVVDRPHCAYA